MNKFLFFNTGWMDYYQGITGKDKITGGGKHVEKEGWGNELFNFQSFQENYYGFVQPVIPHSKEHSDSVIKIERIAGSTTGEKIDNITVVWTAKKRNNGGTYIIGWYKDATVYRKMQRLPKGSGRNWKGQEIGYYVVAQKKNCKLIDIDKRVIKVPRGKNSMGQSNVWYADNNNEFIKIVQDYIFKDVIPIEKSQNGRSTPRQHDLFKRIEVEKKAISIVIKHYEKLGYTIESVEKDNVGWDLTATIEKTKLKLEVKGLSGHDIATELTPNEYKNLQDDLEFYRLCIVTEALEKPKLKIFIYSNENDKWMSEDGTTIEFQKIVSARIYKN